jgi:hypothetical protein
VTIDVTPRGGRGGNAERIVDALGQRPDLDDDQLSRRAGVSPRQQVNIICRRLEQQGLVQRFIGERGKIVNRLTVASDHTHPSPKSAAVVASWTKAGDVDRLDSPPVVVRVDDSKTPTLVIIPCSGRKASGSRQGKADETFLDALPQELAIRLMAARRAVAATAGLDETTLMPAWLRNTGTLYQSAFDANGTAGPPFHHLLILSGAYGVVRATDPIGTYNLTMKESLWLRGLLPEAIEAYARRYELRRAVALVSETTAYAKVIRRVDWVGGDN